MRGLCPGVTIDSDSLPLDAPATGSLIHYLRRYTRPSWWRASFELTMTAGLLFASWFVMWISLGIGYWLTLLIALPVAGFLVRLFMIQHDCGHGAFFPNRFANDWTGRILGILTFTPYDYWKRNHALHHATSGDLGRRGTGDILTLTVDEYLARSAWGRFWYRAYRHPLVMFGVGPAFLFFLQHRLPFGQMRAGLRPWISAIGTNLAIAALACLMIWFVGGRALLAVQLPVMLLAASIGVWLFYVQHQFEQVVWTRDPDWKLHDAALSGSSHYDLPAVLRWFTANIGVHHVHHLCSRIPFYRLRGVLRDHPWLRSSGRVTLAQSLRSVRLALWDESKQRLISFREAGASYPRQSGREERNAPKSANSLFRSAT
jgi:omega-6 fatty acid desaturase (delta-12 desaturase)